MPKLSTRYNKPNGIAALDGSGRITAPILRRLSAYDGFGLVGDGVADDTAALNAALAAGANKTLFVDGGVFKISGQLNIPSNITIVMSPDTEIVCSGINVRSLYMDDKANIRIFGNGAKVTKPRTVAGNTSIYVLGCQNVQIDGLQVNGSAKDGIYVGAGTSGNPSVNTRITNCIINDCRRQGVSVVHAKFTLVDGCEIYGTTGDAPAAGIDLEANADTVVEDSIISNCYFHDNDDQGGVAVLKAKRSLITGCVFRNNLFGVNIDTAGTAIVYQSVAIDPTTDRIQLVAHGFKVGDLVRLRTVGGVMPGGAPSSTIAMFVFSVPDADHFTVSTDYKANQINFTDAGTNVQAGKYDLTTNDQTTITGCLFEGNAHGVYGENSGSATVRGNTFRNNYGGVNLLKMAGCVVSDNRIEASTGGRAIYLTHRHAVVTGNFIDGAKEEGIELVGTEKSVISGNVLKDCGEASDFGVFIKHATDCVVANNTLSCDEALSVTYGIVLDSPTTARCVVTGNTVQGCGSSDANSLIVGASNFGSNNVQKAGFAP